MSEDAEQVLRTQDEINQEYSHFATMSGDRHFRKAQIQKVLDHTQKQIDELDVELKSFNTRMQELVREKPQAKVELLAPGPEDGHVA